MEVDARNAAGVAEYQGRRYYFCSLDCKAAFEEHPEEFLKRTGQAHSHTCC
jgi:YHS domain-containing protein